MNRPTPIARLTVIWTPTLVVAVAAAMVLIDFWFGSQTGRIVNGTYVRVFSYNELYDLVLHAAMLGTALAAALLFAATARRVVVDSAREPEPASPA